MRGCCSISPSRDGKLAVLAAMKMRLPVSMKLCVTLLHAPIFCDAIARSFVVRDLFAGVETGANPLILLLQSDDDRDVPLLKTAKELINASKLFRVRTKQPTVHLVLPRIQPGETPEVDEVLEECRRCGARVWCGDDIERIPMTENAMEYVLPKRCSPSPNLEHLCSRCSLFPMSHTNP